MTDVHDRFFKAAFSDVRMLRALLHAVLPSAVAEHLAGVSWVAAPTESVDRALANRRADLVVSGELSTGPVLVHLEHQSSPDPFLAVRIHVYQARLWDTWLRSKQRLPAPAIVSLVLYNGSRPWDPPTLEETCNAQPGTIHTRVGYGFHEVGEVYRSQRVSDPLLRVVLHALWLGPRGALPLMESLTPSLRSLAERPSDSNDLHVVESLVRYLCSVRPHDSDALISQLLARLPNPYQAMAETTLEYIERTAEARGEARGQARGEAAGLQLGAQRAYREVARRLLQRGVPVEAVAEATGLSLQELVDLAEAD